MLLSLDWIFVAGSANLSVSIGLDAVSAHYVCTAVFVAIVAVVAFISASIPTLSKVSWLAAVGVVAILVSSKLDPAESQWHWLIADTIRQSSLSRSQSVSKTVQLLLRRLDHSLPMSKP